MIIARQIEKFGRPSCPWSGARIIYEESDRSFSAEKIVISIIPVCPYLAFQADACGLHVRAPGTPATSTPGCTGKSVRTDSGTALILDPGEDIFAGIQDMFGHGRPRGVSVTPFQSFEDALMLTRLDLKPA